MRDRSASAQWPDANEDVRRRRTLAVRGLQPRGHSIERRVAPHGQIYPATCRDSSHAAHGDGMERVDELTRVRRVHQLRKQQMLGFNRKPFIAAVDGLIPHPVHAFGEQRAAPGVSACHAAGHDRHCRYSAIVSRAHPRH